MSVVYRLLYDLEANMKNVECAKRYFFESLKKVLISLLASTLSISVSTSDAIVAWERDHIIVKEGDNVTLTCTVTGLEFLAAIRIQLIRIDNSVVTVADSTSVKLPFSQMPRYSFNYSVLEDVGFMTVSYTGNSVLFITCVSL